MVAFIIILNTSQKLTYLFFLFQDFELTILDCAAASRAIGTRNGEQLT